MWNDTDIPIAYLITFRTYGTWLHGDERGSTSRHRSTYGTPKLKHDPRWLEINRERMKRQPVTLDADQRTLVKNAIEETCEIRKWVLHAINVRTNHAHTVMPTSGRSPAIALGAFKANATRVLRVSGLWISELSPWSDKGSNRYLWTEESLGRACDYVKYGQGDDLPEFD